MIVNTVVKKHLIFLTVCINANDRMQTENVVIHRFLRTFSSIFSNKSKHVEPTTTVKLTENSALEAQDRGSISTVVDVLDINQTDKNATQEIKNGQKNFSTKSPRFRRTREEIALGLSIEQAMEHRSTAGSRVQHREPAPEKSADRKSSKRPRFRRTVEEIALGLTIEEAIQRRKVSTAKTEKPKKFMIKPNPVTVSGSLDLLETLSPKIKERATVVNTWRRDGKKGVITQEMLDAATSFTGTITKCPPCVDSDGYNHLHGAQS